MGRIGAAVQDSWDTERVDGLVWWLWELEARKSEVRVVCASERAAAAQRSPGQWEHLSTCSQHLGTSNVEQ